MDVPQGMYCVTMPKKLKDWYSMLKSSIESEPWPSNNWRNNEIKTENKTERKDSKELKQNGLNLVEEEGFDDMENKRLNEESITINTNIN